MILGNKVDYHHFKLDNTTAAEVMEILPRSQALPGNALCARLCLA